MTEEQRHYKILKRTSYEEQISEEEKNTTLRGITLTLSATASLCAIALGASYGFTEMTPRIICAAMGLMNVSFAAKDLKEMMQSISMKTMLKGKIEDIDMELDMPEDNRGMSR